MPATSHVCPKCTYEHPCFFTEGDIVSLKEDLVNEPAPWTGIVLEVERDRTGRVYRILWGPPPSQTSRMPTSSSHSGAHRGDELQRFLVPLFGPQTEIRGSGGGRDSVPHRLGPPGL